LHDGKKPEYPIACYRDDGKTGGAFSLEDTPQLAVGFFMIPSHIMEVIKLHNISYEVSYFNLDDQNSLWIEKRSA
jgi:hypothetical protein